MTSRFSFRQQAGHFEMFTQDAWQTAIGEPCHLHGSEGTLVEAQVAEDGKSVWLTIESPAAGDMMADLLDGLRPIPQ